MEDITKENHGGRSIKMDVVGDKKGRNIILF